MDPLLKNSFSLYMYSFKTRMCQNSNQLKMKTEWNIFKKISAPVVYKANTDFTTIIIIFALWKVFANYISDIHMLIN